MSKASELAKQLDDPKLKDVEGSVYQVWQDGELTLQKCGSLMWQRNLHRIEYPILADNAGDAFPHAAGSNSYAFVTKENAARIRQTMITELLEDPEHRNCPGCDACKGASS